MTSFALVQSQGGPFRVVHATQLKVAQLQARANETVVPLPEGVGYATHEWTGTEFIARMSGSPSPEV